MYIPFTLPLSVSIYVSAIYINGNVFTIPHSSLICHHYVTDYFNIDDAARVTHIWLYVAATHFNGIKLSLPGYSPEIFTGKKVSQTRKLFPSRSTGMSWVYCQSDDRK
jgi:hypothetical protein